MARLMREKFALCIAFLAAISLAKGQNPTAMPLVPAADWRLQSSRTADVNAMREFGGDPVIDREYGVDSVEVRSYELNRARVNVVIEESPDSTTAFGLLTYYRDERMTPVPGMALSVFGPDGGLMARGRYFIRVPRPGAAAQDVSDNDLRALMVVLATAYPGGRISNLPESLPTNGLVPGTQKYLLGPAASEHALPNFRTDLIGFSQGAEVQMGSYSQGGPKPATVLAIAYPTPQIARARFGEMESILKLNQDSGPGSTFGKRLGSFIVVVLDAESAKSASKLTDAFTLTGRVVTNEPYPGDKPIALQVMELIVDNILFVFVLSGIAVGGGILVYVSKRFMRKRFPDSLWVEPEEGSLTVIKLI